MPLAEPDSPAAPGRAGAAGVQAPVAASVTGWGGGPQVAVGRLAPESAEELRLAVGRLSRDRDRCRDGAIARGQGRSYGDAAQLRGGLVLDTSRLQGIALGSEQGTVTDQATVTAQAGVTLGRLLGELAPAGWTLPVVPGTQHVSVGGAIASDIHGKNHASAGTFGRHVRALGLLTAAGEELVLTPSSHPELFGATLGGMGLTGVILWARLALTPLESGWLSVDSDRVQRLDDALAALLAPGGSHRVAWLDLLGRPLVRGVVTRAQPMSEPPPGRTGAPMNVTARLTVPEGFPGALLRRGVVSAHNELRFRRAPRAERGRPEPFGAHMFPLDVLASWPRLYGRSGFVQYQLALPRGQEPVLESLIERLRNSAVPCYLAVLKDLGPAGGAPLSFPIAGWTLTLDLPRAAPALVALLHGFDELVAGAGGRVYLAKDAHLRPDLLAAMYPRLDEWRAVRDQVDPEGLWRSDLALRTGLIEARR